jgi:hypothetical protein
MSNIVAYPSIYAIGHAAIRDIFSTDVIVEEKIDGSQFSFKWTDGCGITEARSKGAELDISNNGDNCNKLFQPAVKTMLQLAKDGKLKSGWIYRGEALCKPKHNTLAYNRAPETGFILFDIDDGLQNYMSRADKEKEASRLGLEIVPVLFQGKVDNFEQIQGFMEQESCLGGIKIEGFVVKNYNLFTVEKKVMLGKYVSEAFKEKHRSDWKADHPNKADIMTALEMTYRNENRWIKAIQHLQERGELKGMPEDIGPLMKEVSLDVLKEEQDEIKQKLFDWAWRRLSTGVTKGLAQWYKERLAQNALS